MAILKWPGYMVPVLQVLAVDGEVLSEACSSRLQRCALGLLMRSALSSFHRGSRSMKTVLDGR